MEFNTDQFHRLRYHLHERAIPFVKYEHDYREFKRTNISHPFFTRSMLNIFISPQHQQRHAEIFGEEILEKSVALPLAIDTNLFTSGIGVDREENLVLVPNYKKCGDRIDQYMRENEKYRYAVIGQVPQLPGRVEHLPKVPNEQMPQYYARCSSMLHLPRDYWAGERLLFEAALCGCTPVVDTEHVGHCSWGFDLSDTVNLKAKLDKAPFTFWREIDKCL
jgi:glycosyltransferase involved in cell wall biosynthesis